MTAHHAFTLPTGAYGEPLPLEWDEPCPLALAVLDRVGLFARAVVDDEDVEWLRAIRNTCRAGFSNDRAVITAPQQRAWWAAMCDKLVAYLYGERANGFIVGYGLLRQTDDRRWWSSVAVLPEWGGHGYGGAITRHIIRQSSTGVVWASARNDNPAALKLHCPADWEAIGCDQDLTYYRTREGLTP